jgi:hypothetical protein
MKQQTIDYRLQATGYRLPATVVAFFMISQTVMVTAQTPTGSAGIRTASPVSLTPAVRLDDYRLLTERNIFLKDRRVVISRPPRPTGPSPTDVSRPSFVLTGVVWYGEDWVAFFEDSRTGQSIRVTAGQGIGDGLATSAGIGTVDVKRGPSTTRVAIGQDLTGSTALMAGSGAPMAQPTATSPGDAALTTSAPAGTDDIVERMRRKRAEELSK